MKAQHWLKGGALARTVCALLLFGCGECGSPGNGNGSNNSGADMNVQDMDESRDDGTLPDPDLPPEMDMSQDMPVDGDMGADMGGDMGAEDTSAPVVTITSAMLAGVDGTYKLTGTLMDDVGVESAVYVLGEGTEQELTFASGMFSVDLMLVDDPTSITVYAEDAAGNRGEASIDVEFEEPPPMVTASFTVSGMPQINQAIVFDASTSTGPDGEELTYTWTFSDGVTRDGVKVGRIFHEPGPIQATLLVESTNLSDQADQQVMIGAPMPVGTAELSGEVVDGDIGALKGVEVLDESGQVLATTDAYGKFQLTIDRAVPVVLRYRREGWADQIQRIIVPERESNWKTQAQLIRHGETHFLQEAAQGGEVLTSQGVRVTFPADAFVNEQGLPVDGDISVRITPLDTSGEDFGAFPGGPMAMNSQGDVSFMATHGVMEVELRQDQREVFIAPGKLATIEIPMVTDVTAGSQVDLWSLDENSGLWVSEGKGQVIQANGGFALQADVSHFSWWNADDFVPQHEAEIKLSSSAATPVMSNGPLQINGATPAAETSASGVSAPRAMVSMSLDSLPQNFKLPLPINVEMNVSIMGNGGDLRCLGRFTPAGNEPFYNFDCVDLSDPNEPTKSELVYGDTVTHAFGATGDEQIFTFDAQAGDLARIRLTSKNSSQASAVIISEGGWEILPTVVGANRTEEIVYPVPSDRNVKVAVRAGTVAGEVDVSLDKITDLGIEQEEVVDVTANDNTSKNWAFWANEGQTIHVRFYGEVPFDSVQLFHAGQTILPSSDRFGSLDSLVYEIPETGLYLLKQDIFGGVNAAGVQYTFTITDMPPPSYVATSRGRAIFSGDLDVPGKVYRYVSPVSASESILARPRVSVGAPHPHIAERYNFVGSWSESPRSSEESEGGLALEKLGPAVTGTKPYFHAIFHKDGTTGAYEVDIEKLSEVSAVTVGDSSCATSETTYLPLAVSALTSGGTITLCDGTHETFDGISIGDGAAIVGSSSDMAILKGWREKPIIEDGVARLEGVTLFLDGRNGVSITYDRANPVPVVLEDVRVVGASNSSSNAAISIDAIGTHQGSDIISIDGVEITGPIATGVRLSGVNGATADNISVTDATAEAISLTSTDGVVLTNLFLDNVRHGVLADSGRVTNTTIDGGIILIGNSVVGGNFGISLLERSDNNAPSGSSVIRGVDIELAADGDTGISVGVGSTLSSVVVEQNSIDGDNHATRGVWVQPQVLDSGDVRIANNIIIENDLYNVQVMRADRLDRFEFVNNSIGTTSSSAISFDLVRIVFDTAVSTGEFYFYNNLFVGHGTDIDRAIVLSQSVLIAADYNLFWNMASNYWIGGGVQADSANDISGMDPLLSNSSLELLPLSPAVDAGGMTLAPAVDYNGTSRPLGNGIDIGAHEQ